MNDLEIFIEDFYSKIKMITNNKKHLKLVYMR